MLWSPSRKKQQYYEENKGKKRKEKQISPRKNIRIRVYIILLNHGESMKSRKQNAKKTFYLINRLLCCVIDMLWVYHHGMLSSGILDFNRSNHSKLISQEWEIERGIYIYNGENQYLPEEKTSLILEVYIQGRLISCLTFAIEL